MSKFNRVDKETAEADFDRFIEKLDVSEKKLDAFLEPDENGKSPKDDLVSLIEYGIVVINDDDSAIVKLHETIGTDDSSISYDEFKFKTKRMRVEDIEKQMTGKNDIEKTRKAFAFLCNVAPGIMKKMDTDDFANVSVVAQFFL